MLFSNTKIAAAASLTLSLTCASIYAGGSIHLDEEIWAEAIAKNKQATATLDYVRQVLKPDAIFNSDMACGAMRLGNHTGPLAGSNLPPGGCLFKMALDNSDWTLAFEGYALATIYDEVDGQIVTRTFKIATDTDDDLFGGYMKWYEDYIKETVGYTRYDLIEIGEAETPTKSDEELDAMWDKLNDATYAIKGDYQVVVTGASISPDIRSED